LEWPLDYSLHDGIEFHQEFHTKPAALSFIPCNGVDDIEVSLVP
jgi:hypothetical protein